MKSNLKTLIASAAVVILGLAYIVYPVHAEERKPLTEPQANDSLQLYAANNAGDFNVTGGTSGTSWTYDNSANTLTFNNSGTYTVTGNGTETTESIVVADNFTGTITIENINISLVGCPFEVKNTAKLILILKGQNTLTSYRRVGCAGLEFAGATDGTLTIDGTGSLFARGGQFGAGIGGGFMTSANNITINGGTVTANGGQGGAGIGGGIAASASNIVITGGNVYAQGGVNGDGIGGGAGIGGGGNYYENLAGSLDTLKISGGTVTAGGMDGYGIGDGNRGDPKSSNISITGGSVKATSQYRNAISVTPTNAGSNVYLAKLDNLSGINEVTVDGSTYTRAGDHPDGDGVFYLYLTGENHNIQAGGKSYAALWNQSGSNFTIKQKQKPPTPQSISGTSSTASSITVGEPTGAATYGGVEYSRDGSNWQDSGTFTDLKSNTEYTVYARYKGNLSYTVSDSVSTKVTTKAATYTITIPAEPLEAGNAESKSEIKPADSFDIGYGGRAVVKIKSNSGVSNDGKLTLTRTVAGNTITSALLLNTAPLTDITKPIATFYTKTDSPVMISFAKPAETNILAGDYRGTVTFTVTYSEP